MILALDEYVHRSCLRDDVISDQRWCHRTAAMIRVTTPAAALHGANHQSRPLRTQMTTQCSVPIAMANVAITIPANVIADCHDATQRSGSGQVCTDQTIAAANITGGANSNETRTALSRLRPSPKPAATGDYIHGYTRGRGEAARHTPSTPLPILSITVRWGMSGAQRERGIMFALTPGVEGDAK